MIFVNSGKVEITNTNITNFRGVQGDSIVIRGIQESRFIFDNNIFDQIYNPVYLIRHYSTLVVTNTVFKNIETSEDTWVGQVLRASARLTDCTFENVKSQAPYLFQFRESGRAEYSPSWAVLPTRLERVTFRNVNQTILKIEVDSNVEIEDCTLDTGRQGIQIKNSEVLANNLSFNAIGDADIIGGGFDVYDSNLTVANSMFNKMFAKTGASIDLDCQGQFECRF